MLSGRLASPKPSEGGEPEEHGNEENETQSRDTVQSSGSIGAVKGDKTLAELAEHFRVHPTQITEWKQQLLAWTADVLGGSTPTAETPGLKTLHAKIGQLALEHDCLEGALTNTRRSICMPLKPSVPPTRA